MAAIDDYSAMTPGVTSPPKHFAIVSLSDSTDLTHVARVLLVFGAGNVKVTTLGGETLVLTGLPAGFVLVGFITRVWSTSTTATNIVAGW